MQCINYYSSNNEIFDNLEHSESDQREEGDYVC